MEGHAVSLCRVLTIAECSVAGMQFHVNAADITVDKQNRVTTLRFRHVHAF